MSALVSQRQAPVADPLAWLDHQIAAQAAHYGLSPERKGDLFAGAAQYGELIEHRIVEEPEHEA